MPASAWVSDLNLWCSWYRLGEEFDLGVVFDGNDAVAVPLNFVLSAGAIQPRACVLLT